MSVLRFGTLSMVLVLLLVAAATPALCAGNPDAGFLTTYSVRGTSSPVFVDWVVCGNFPDGAGGCFGAGSFGPLGAVGALLESAPKVVGKAVTRRVYVLDTASGGAANGVTLYVYKKTDTIVEPYPSTTYSLVKTLALPLIGGVGAHASMAANAGFLFVGTNLSSQAVQIAKNSWALTLEDASNDPITVTSISSNAYGYVTITHGISSGDSEFNVYRPDGLLWESGGGGSFILDTRNGFVPANLPLFP